MYGLDAILFILNHDEQEFMDEIFPGGYAETRDCVDLMKIYEHTVNWYMGTEETDLDDSFEKFNKCVKNHNEHHTTIQLYFSSISPKTIEWLKKIATIKGYTDDIKYFSELDPKKYRDLFKEANTNHLLSTS